MFAVLCYSLYSLGYKLDWGQIWIKQMIASREQGINAYFDASIDFDKSWFTNHRESIFIMKSRFMMFSRRRRTYEEVARLPEEISRSVPY